MKSLLFLKQNPEYTDSYVQGIFSSVLYHVDVKVFVTAVITADIFGLKMTEHTIECLIHPTTKIKLIFTCRYHFILFKNHAIQFECNFKNIEIAKKKCGVIHFVKRFQY